MNIHVVTCTSFDLKGHIVFQALHSKLGMDTEGTRYAIKSCTNQDQNGKAKLMMSLEPPGTMPTSLDKGEKQTKSLLQI